jgi:hypothetical protein
VRSGAFFRSLPDVGVGPHQRWAVLKMEINFCFYKRQGIS